MGKEQSPLMLVSIIVSQSSRPNPEVAPVIRIVFMNSVWE